MENNLKKLRLNAGLSQTELGAKSGIDKKNIWRYENNPDLRNVTIGTLYSIAEAMGVTVNDIIYSLKDEAKADYVLNTVLGDYAKAKDDVDEGDINAAINNRFM